MSPVWIFSCCLVLSPFLGMMWGRRGVMAGSFFGVLGLGVVAFLSTHESMRISILGQGLPLIALGWGLCRLIVPSAYFDKETTSLSSETVASLRKRYQLLREAVAKGDQEEARSLQIYGVAKGLAESLSWKEMAPRLFTGLQKLFGAYDFLLYSIDEQGRWNLLQKRGTWAKDPPLPTLTAFTTTMFYPPHIQEPVPVLSIPIMPVSGDQTLSGALFLKSFDMKIPQDELVERGREFGEQLGVALKKALLFNQMEIHSRVDGLTGVLRRQPFMDRLNEELKRAGVFHTPFSLMMVDIDYFKAVNDTHGHAAGDAVLKRVGQILKESVYETDVVGRYGGEEFIILLPRAQTEGVLRKAEALRKRFESEVIAFGFESLRVTVSIGLAHFPIGGKTAEVLIGNTDKALYQAKEGGRNRVVAA